MHEITTEEEISQVRENLFKTINELATHMKVAHGGIMTTTCHNCMSKKAIIDDNKMFIEESERDIMGLNGSRP